MILTKSQQRYPHYQNLLLAIAMTSRKVSHYFDEHPITIVSSTPLAGILNNPGATGRVAEWNIELSPRDLQFKNPAAIKAQVLPDLLVEWVEVQTPGPPDLSNSWTMFFDGSKRQQGAGAGVVLVSPKRTKLKYVLQINFSNASNNEAEYEALLHGMRMAKTCRATRLIIYGDSNLVVQQAMRDCDAVAEHMASYQQLYNALEGSFDGCELNYIIRANNTEADELANIGSTRGPVPPGVFLESINQRSIKTKAVAPEATMEDDAAEPAHVAAANSAEDEGTRAPASTPPTAVEGPAWTRPFLRFLIGGTLPQEVTEARHISRRSKAFTVINKQLYKRSIAQILQKCIDEEDDRALLLEIHEGTCGHHASSRVLVSMAFRAGFYWPTAMKNAEDIVRCCIACQKFANRPHAPASELKTIPLSWSFTTWGLDMVGPLKKSSKGGRTHLLIAVDKFTKWIKAVPITSSTTLTTVNFIKSIIVRFGVPHNIITDNGTNFTTAEFQNFCEELGIKINYASVAHPQSNGQVEKANGLVCGGIKKRLREPLEQAVGNWVEELPAVLWSLRTTPNTVTQYTPFFMVYGAEAVLPHDLKFGAPRISGYEEEEAEEALQDDKDIAEEARDTALARSEWYQDNLHTCQSSRLRTSTFSKGDLVLRLIQEKVHKLAPQWE